MSLWLFSSKIVSESDFVVSSVEFLASTIVAAIASRGVCVIGLSGGSTPFPVYSELGKRGDIDWSKVYVFLVDERFIEPSHKDSNAFNVRRTLLASAAIPEDHIIFPSIRGSVEETVDDYDSKMTKLIEQHGAPDIVTLGIGDDGHIASIFPTVPTEIVETTRLVAHTTTERFAVRDRITVTFHVLRQAASSVFFLKGAAKKPVWDEMVASEKNTPRWPAHEVLETKRVTLIGSF